jgi:hypothetical protein
MAEERPLPYPNVVTQYRAQRRRAEEDMVRRTVEQLLVVPNLAVLEIKPTALRAVPPPHSRRPCGPCGPTRRGAAGSAEAAHMPQSAWFGCG